MRRKLALESFLLVIAIFAVNLLANKFYWYVAIPWFDMLMHFLGGVFLALATGAFFAKLFLGKPFLHILPALLASVLLFGTLWEAFEYSVQSIITFAHLASIPDSFSDIIFDLLGGFVGTLFVYRAAKRYNRTNG